MIARMVTTTTPELNPLSTTPDMVSLFPDPAYCIVHTPIVTKKSNIFYYLLELAILESLQVKNILRILQLCLL